ncbi:MAG: hypothetical protein HKN33_11335, partial [Pyrinomonadaceae bacterium]|nr:hypothetical protein [Pyrinomonadaceae bacterium]
MRILRAFAALLIFTTAICGQSNSGVEVTPGNEGLTVEYIANEGISITHGKHRILLDAIHRQYKPAYAFTPEDILSKIESARYPYGNTSLILVSHNHLDHFHAESIARHLMNNNNAVLVSSDQVVDEVEKSGAELKKLFPRRSAKP